jgi:acyl dehydratase
MKDSKMFFEDFEIGLVFNTGSKKITKDEIISFAKNYDPQYFHVDENKAKYGPFGTLVSSGFMTLGVSFTQFFETGVVKDTGMGAWGIDELRWTFPVYPNDELKSEVKVIEKKLSSKNPNKGTVRTLHTVTNQNDKVVMTWIANFLIKTKN